MRLSLTMLGAKGLVFFAAIELAFLATAYSNLFFLLLVFLGATALLGALGAIHNLRGIRVTVLRASPAPAGTKHELQVRIEAPRPARFQLQVRLDVGSGWCEALQVPLVVGDITLPATVGPLPRGVHPVRAIALVSRHPFGLLRTTRIVSPRGEPSSGNTASVELVAHPPPAPLPPGDPREALARWTGNRLRPHGRDQLAGLRRFRPGDALRDVHWRATARHRFPIVAERDADADTELAVCFDRRADDERFDEALSVLTALVLATQQRKQTIRIDSQDHAAVYGDGQQPYNEALRWLAAVQPLPHDAAAPRATGPEAVHLPLQPRQGLAAHA